MTDLPRHSVSVTGIVFRDDGRVLAIRRDDDMTWVREIRHSVRPHYRVYPAGTPGDALDLPAGTSRVINKARSRLTISWPQAAGAGAGQVIPAIPAPEATAQLGNVVTVPEAG